MEILYGIISYLLNFAVGLMQFITATTVTNCRRSKPKLLLSTFALMTLYSLAMYAIDLSIIQPIYVLLFNLILLVVFKISIGKALVLSMSVYFISYAIDFLLTLILITFAPGFWQEQSSAPNTWLANILKALAASLYILVYYIIRRYQSQIQRFMDTNMVFRGIGGHLVLLFLIAYPTTNRMTAALFTDVHILDLYTFGMITLLILYSAYQTINNAKYVTTQAEYAYNMRYCESLEQMIYQWRSFRHDFGNIISDISGYVDLEEFDRLKTYIQDVEKDLSHVKSASVINSELRAVPALYGVLLNKLSRAEFEKIRLDIDIQNSTELPAKIKESDLSRIIGILLDNAVEAAMETEEKNIRFQFWNNDGLSVEIRNSFSGEVDLDAIRQEHMTSKEGHSGFGLYEVDRIIGGYRRRGVTLDVSYSVEGGEFVTLFTAD